jgi:DNA polymerase-3 subunit gamma/tau
MENLFVRQGNNRPSTFETVVGQGALTSTLKNAIEATSAHAYLLLADPEVWERLPERVFLSRTINRMNLTPTTKPATHAILQAFNEQRSTTSMMDAASNNSVDNNRSL